MSKLAWLYLSAVFTLSGMLIALASRSLPAGVEQWMICLVLVALAALAQFYEIKHERRYSYYPHTVFFLAGVILLPSALLLVLIVVPHLIEWALKRLQKSNLLQNWYIQPFNISTHILAGFAAHAIYHSAPIREAAIPAQLGAVEDILSAYFAIVVYILVNHALVGQALVLARGISWQESEVMSLDSLLIEMVMASLGYIMAVLWSVNPWLLAPFVISLFLLAQALMVPQLKKEVKTDAKTGLLNAKHFQNQLESELQRAQRFQHPLALILADLDLLREVNNTYGHLAGDAVIQGVAQVIQEHAREYDVAGRFGGEEFAIILPETEGQEALLIAERLRRAVQAAVFKEGSLGTPMRATISLGVATYPGDADSAEQLIGQADTALYLAKYRGRNCTAMAANVPHSHKVEQGISSFDFGMRKTSTSDPSVGGEGLVQRPDAQTEAHTTGEGEQTLRATESAAERSGQAPTDPQAEKVGSSRQAPSVLLRLFLGGVILAGLMVAGWGFYFVPRFDWLGVGLFLVLATLAEANQLDLFENNTISTSVAASLAAAVIGGIPGAVLASATITLIHYVKMRPAWYKSLFNWATHLLAALPAALFITVLDIPLSVAFLPVLTLFAVPVILLVYLIESGLMAAAMGLAMGAGIVLVWRERFLWLSASYLVMGIIGLFLAVGYAVIGVSSIALFVLPVLVVYATQKMYIQRTEASVRELRRMNHELAEANGEISKASNKIQRLNDQLFLTLAKIIDARDSNVAGHASRVAAYATALARELKLPAEQREYIRQAALLHDIGKLGIPERILYKSTKLNHDEYQVVKRHAEVGAEMLEMSDGLRPLASAVRHHHERWDGRGYPHGLKREQIPLASRILALCDAVEVMVSGRHYEPAKSIEDILGEVRRNMGTQFDPVVAEAFIKLVQERKSVWSDLASPPRPPLQGKALDKSTFPAGVLVGSTTFSAQA